MTAAQLSVHVINIDRAADRLAALASQARALDIDLRRVAGVDGRQVAPERREGADERLFFRRNGRTLLPGEYGCYRSHMLAWRQFLESGREAAIIVEDDVALDARLLPRAAAILRAVPQAGLIKLVNHRSTGFLAFAASQHGDRIGRCVHGPQGSAACYLLTRAGAQRMLDSMRIMSLPLDIALERGWATGVAVYTVERNILDFGPLRPATTIATGDEYRAAKAAQWRRIPTHLFRAGDALSRFVYAVSGFLRARGRGESPRRP